MDSKTKLSAFCDALIEAGWLAALVVVPLFFNVHSSRVFEPDKISTLRSIAMTMVFAWIVKVIEQGLHSDRSDTQAEFVVEDQLDQPTHPVRRLWQRVVRMPLALPTLALVAVYLVSTIFSVVPRVSLAGSYQRLQGTYSMLSYIVVFAMMLQNMRKKEQIERLVTTVVLTSIPIALYGILQHYGLDPLPWGGDVRKRVAGHMGNAIFIAAYMIMALPFTLYRAVESFTAILTSNETRVVDIVLGASYVFVLAIQVICVFFTQSRGPWLGLVGGLFFFFLVLAVVRRWRWLVWATVIAVLAAAIFLLVFNLPSSPLESLRKVQYIGRLGRVLDKEERTSKVRLLIWKGAVEMVLPHPPLEKPDGSKDWMNWARPLIGYGPESMYVAYNRFYQPDLAHYEKRNASPDRSHNETFDSLVITGVIGFLVYMWLFASVFYFGFKWLGMIHNRGQRNFFIATWIGGGTLGATAMGLWQGIEFVGAGLPAGIAAGLGVYLVVWGLFLSRQAAAEEPGAPGEPIRDAQGRRVHQQRIQSAQSSEQGGQPNPYRLLVVALVAAMIAHFVEIHFGIAIGATRTYFWSCAGLLVVTGYLLPRQWEMAQQGAMTRSEAQIGASHSPLVTRHSKQSVRDARRHRRKGGKTAAASHSPLVTRHSKQREKGQKQGTLAGIEAILPYALVLALILSTLAYDFVSSNPNQLDSPQQILWSSLARRISNKESVPSYGILELVVITWLLSTVIVVGEWIRRGGSGSAQSGSWRALMWTCLSVSMAIAFLFAMVLAGRLASVVQQTQLLEVTRLVMGMLSSYYVLAFLVIAMTAFALVRETALPARIWQPTSVWLYPILLIALTLVIVNTNLKVVHADIIYKQAEPYERQDYWDFSIVLHQEAIQRTPNEDFYYLFLGRAFLEKSRSAPSVDQLPRTFKVSEVLQLIPQQMANLSREDMLNCSDAVLKRAREINPLNTDHSANLGRLYRTRAEMASDPEKKQAYFQRALQYYAEATSLSPQAAHLFDEWGLVYFSMGEYQEAIAKYEHSIEIDDMYVTTYLSLGDAYRAVDELDKAREAYLNAVVLDPSIPEVHSVLALLYGMDGRIDEAISETLQVLELTSERVPQDKRIVYQSYKNLALYYQKAGRLEEAMQAAQEALARAPENEREALRGFIAQLAEGGVTPETELLVQQFLSEGEVALNSKQWAAAEEAYAKALGLNPNLVVAHSALAYIYAHQGRLEEAEQENQIVLSTIPGDFATLKNLAIIYQQLQRYDDAIVYAQQAFQSPDATEEDKQQLQVFINNVKGLKASG